MLSCCDLGKSAVEARADGSKARVCTHARLSDNPHWCARKHAKTKCDVNRRDEVSHLHIVEA